MVTVNVEMIGDRDGMSHRQTDDKPSRLPEPLITNVSCQSNPWEQISVKTDMMKFLLTRTLHTLQKQVLNERFL